MLTEDHPNARWLAEMYGGGAAIATDPTLDAEGRERRQKTHELSVVSRMSPDLAIHTGGVKSATDRGSTSSSWRATRSSTGRPSSTGRAAAEPSARTRAMSTDRRRLAAARKA